jgi:hypothetical protein
MPGGSPRRPPPKAGYPGEWQNLGPDGNAKPVELVFCPDLCQALEGAEEARVDFGFTCLGG